MDSNGAWPGGIIYYKFADGDPCPAPAVQSDWQKDVRRAMDDWEKMTGGTGMTINFQCTSSPKTSIFPVLNLLSDSNQCSGGYQGCRAAGPTDPWCDLHLGNSAYHEMGHCLGLGMSHEWNRYESRHYLGLNATSTAICDVARHGGWGPRGSIPTSQNLLDFGPFDYLSTMSYGSLPFPETARWDGSPYMPGAATCGGIGGPSVPPPTCTGTFCQPTCGMCLTDQPQGFPTLGDASAAAELYRNLREPAWRKFARTVEEDVGGGVLIPFDYSLASGVTIPNTASPAVAFEAPATTSIWVTGSNGQVYTKARASAGGTWPSWTSLGSPTGSGTASDPAVVSWGAGRDDVTVTKGNVIFIRTFQNGSWGTWQSLGQPASVPPSPPAISSSGPNRLDLFVRGADNRLYWKKCTAACNGSSGTWSGWTQIGGTTETFRGKPAAVSASNGTGTAYVYVHNMSGHVRQLFKNASEVWSSWADIANPGGLATNTLPGGTLKWDPSCPACSSPAAGGRGSAIDVYVRGNDDKIWISTVTPGSPSGFSSFVPLGGVSMASPGSISMTSSGNLAAVAITMREERTRTSSGVTYANGVWLKDYDARHTYPAQVALGVNGDGRLETLYQGPNDVLYSKWQSPPPASDTWTTALMSGIKDRAKLVTVAVNADSRLEAIFTGPDDLLRYIHQWTPGGAYAYADATNAFVNPSSTPTMDMAVARNTDGRLQLVYVGTDLSLHQTSQTTPGGGWDGEHLLGQSFSFGKRVAMDINLNGQLEVVMIDANDILQYALQNVAGSETWTIALLNSPVASAKRLTMRRNADGRIQVVFIGLDDVLYQSYQTSPGGSWSQAQLLAQPYNTAKEVALAQDQDGRLEVIMVDSNNVIQSARQNTVGGTSWTLAVIQSGVRANRLAAARNGSGQIEAVYVGTDDVTLYRVRQTAANGTTWTAPVSF